MNKLVDNLMKIKCILLGGPGNGISEGKDVEDDDAENEDCRREMDFESFTS